MKKAKNISKSVWEDLGLKFIMRGKGFYVSFNPDTNADPLGKLFNEVGSSLGSILGKPRPSDGRAETALVKKDKFLILDGDFRKEYEKLVPKGYDACLKFFNSKKQFKSGWSN